MKKKIVFCALFFLLLSCAKTEKQLLICDFNGSDRINALGGEFGSWNKDSYDTTQFCEDALVEGRGGKVLQLTYDVDSPNPAYNGFWMKLQGANLSGYKKLTFWVKGDLDSGYTQNFNVELKNNKGEKGTASVSGITDEWQKIEIPLKNFDGISDLSNVSELVFVFSDTICEPKAGIIYIDDIIAK